MLIENSNNSNVVMRILPRMQVMSLILVALMITLNSARAKDIVPPSELRVNIDQALNYGVEISVEKWEGYVSVEVIIREGFFCNYSSVSADSIRNKFFFRSEYVSIPIEHKDQGLYMVFDRRLLVNFQMSFKCSAGSDVRFFIIENFIS